MVIYMDIELVKGVGKVTLDYLKKLQIFTIEDLVEYSPYRYNILRIIPVKEVKDGETCTIRGIVDTEAKTIYIKKLNKLTIRIVADNYLMNVVIFNRAFLKNQLKVGRMINVVGKYDSKRNQFTASDINFEIINSSKIYPVYHLVNGLKNKILTNIIREALNTSISLDDYIPDYLVDKYMFLDKLNASSAISLA